MINKRKGNKISKEDRQVRELEALSMRYEVHYPNMCVPEMKTENKQTTTTKKKKKQEKEI